MKHPMSYMTRPPSRSFKKFLEEGRQIRQVGGKQNLERITDEIDYYIFNVLDQELAENFRGLIDELCEECNIPKTKMKLFMNTYIRNIKLGDILGDGLLY